MIIGKTEIGRIKSDLQNNVGSKVKFASRKGRKRKIIQSGVIESIYPSVFIIKVDSKSENDTADTRVSYSYADVITHTVELALCK